MDVLGVHGVLEDDTKWITGGVGVVILGEVHTHHTYRCHMRKKFTFFITT